MWEFKQIEDLYLRIVAPGSLFIEFIHMNLYFAANKNTMYMSYYDKVYELL